MKSHSTNGRIASIRRVGAVMTIALAAMASAACSPGASQSSSAASTTLTIAAPNGPLSLDPALNGNGTPLVWFTRLAYDPLINRDAKGDPQPGLATAWRYSDDRLSFVITLREGVKFSDGSDLTADAVAASMEYWKAHTTFPYLANVATIAPTGPLEVTLKLSTPDPLLPYAFDQEGQAGDIIAPSGVANPGQLGAATLGAGPYTLDPAATVANSSYVYVKNPTYWDQSSIHYEKVIVKVIADDNSLLAALRSGQVQAAQVNNSSVAAGKSAGLAATSARSAMVGIYLADIDGTVQPQLKDLRVRQALNLAVDRTSITKALYGDTGTATDQYAADGTPGYDASLEDLYPYDPDKAKKLLADAGYPDGFDMTLVVQPGALNQNLLAQTVVEQWAKVGVRATINAPTAFPDYVQLLMSKAYPATTLNFYYSAHLTIMQGLFTNPALYNFFGYNDQGANDLVAEQRQYDVDSAEGDTAAATSERYVVENALAVPIASVDTVMLSTKTVSGLDFTSAFPIPDPTKWKPAN